MVKLHQFSEDDTDQKAIDTRKAEFRPGSVEGLSELTLHETKGETEKHDARQYRTQLVANEQGEGEKQGQGGVEDDTDSGEGKAPHRGPGARPGACRSAHCLVTFISPMLSEL